MRKIILKIFAASSAIAITFGMVVGLALADTEEPFLNIDETSTTLNYESGTPKETKWNCESTNVFKTKAHTSLTSADKYKYEQLLIDGVDHMVLDKSFNQSSYQGIVDWVWTDNWQPGAPNIAPLAPENQNKIGSANATKPLNSSKSGFVDAMKAGISEGRETIVLSGYEAGAAITDVVADEAKYPFYTNGGFVAIDCNVKDGNHIASVMFRADEATFLTAIAACDYLEQNYDHYIKKGPLAIGTFGGINIPTVSCFMGGLQRGIVFYNKVILPSIYSDTLEREKHEVKFINLGALDSYFTGSFSIGDGRTLTQTLLAKGADVILPVAGPQTNDVIQEIKNQNSDCVVIGVDTAQELSDINKESSFTDAGGNNKIIKFSAQKNIAALTSYILDLAYQQKEKTDDGKIGSFGYLTIGDVSNDGVKLSDLGQPYLTHAFNLVPGCDGKTYDELIQYLLLSTTVFDKIGTKNTFDYINDHMTFSYRGK